jgi:RNA polymerase sigma-70 factor (ECF subfamily)
LKTERLTLANLLVARIAKGDTQALDELFTEFGGLLFAMCKKYLFDKSFAEDLVSDVLLTVVKESPKIKSIDNSLNWMFKIIHNKATNINKRANKIIFEGFDETKSLSTIISFTEKSLDIGALHAALEQLPERENRLLYYKFWEGLTIREIAKELKASKSTIQREVDGALSALRKTLNEGDEQNG